MNDDARFAMELDREGLALYGERAKRKTVAATAITVAAVLLILVPYLFPSAGVPSIVAQVATLVCVLGVPPCWFSAVGDWRRVRALRHHSSAL